MRHSSCEYCREFRLGVFFLFSLPWRSPFFFPLSSHSFHLLPATIFPSSPLSLLLSRSHSLSHHIPSFSSPSFFSSSLSFHPSLYPLCSLRRSRGCERRVQCVYARPWNIYAYLSWFTEALGQGNCRCWGRNGGCEEVWKWWEQQERREKRCSRNWKQMKEETMLMVGEGTRK